MCGIAGIVDWRAATAAPTREAHLTAMLARIAHRGPDGKGLRIDPHIALGAVRLGIVDPVGGTQPMADPSGRWWIAYNGEVYNFVELRRQLEAAGCTFRTRCDTEVVLQAWMRLGPAAVEQFDGGFAFALYDRRARALHLVRDRYGKRPLFMREHGGMLCFASEIKAFRIPSAPPLVWNPDAVADIFAHWTLVDGDTPYAGITQVRAGTIITLTPDVRSERRWGGFDPPRRDAAISIPVAAEQARALLVDAVDLRLRGDAEPAVLLSGGLDSAIVAWLTARRCGEGLRTFSLGFVDTAYDERSDQARLAAALDLTPVTVTVGDDDIADAFGQAAWHAEVPQFRTALAPMYLLYRTVADAGIKVVLSGEGSDEVFLGYDLFRETRLRASWSALDRAERRQALARLYPYLDRFSNANAAALEQVFGRAAGPMDALLSPLALRLDNGNLALRLLVSPGQAPERLAAAAEAAGLGDSDPIVRAQWLEFATLLQGYLLSSQGDRMAFAHGIEPRCPFLAHAVVAFANALPETHHLSRDGVEKYLLKTAFASALPDWLLAKPKQPYRAPGATAFRDPTGGLRDWVADLLSPEALAATGLIDARQAARLVQSVAGGVAPVSPRHDQAFLLLLSLSMLDRLFVSGPVEPVPPITIADVRAIEDAAF